MFNILQMIEKELLANGILIDGMSHNPFRLDFKKNESYTLEQMELAEQIAYSYLNNEDYYRQQWEQEQRRLITSEKAVGLVQLLINKGILTEQEVNEALE